MLIAPVEVALTKDWAGQHKQFDAGQTQELLADFAKLARKELARDLTHRGGFAPADAAAPDVLELRAFVSDLDIVAPEIRDAAVRRDFVYSHGSATLVVEVRDSLSGKLLARMADHREMRNYYPQLRLANSVTNDAEASDLIEAWALALRRQLITARADSKGS